MSDMGRKDVVKEPSDGSQPPQREESVLMHDQDLRRRVVNFLLAHQIPALRRVQVQASGGSVILYGTVRSFYQKQLCLNCCRRVAGVIEVMDCLDVVSATANPLQSRGDSCVRK
jgi:osmotically-inducible protein OsmY